MATRISLIVTLLFLVPARSYAQQVDYKRESPAVAVLRAVMLYRLEHLDDWRARFDACRAYEAMGRPADLFVSQYDYYRDLLDRQGVASCNARDERSAADRLPSVWIDSLVIADSVATMRVTVIRGSDAEERRHEEVYSVERGFRPPSRPAGVWYVARVELSAGSRVHKAPRRRPR